MRSFPTSLWRDIDQGDRILLISADPDSHQQVRDYLGGQGFAIDQAKTAESALAKIHTGNYHTILLEICAAFDGFELLSKMRELPEADSIMLIGPNNEVDRILALEIGADDYLGQPFHPRELLARIHALHRRKHKQSENGRLVVDEIEMDLHARTVTWRDQTLELTTSEFGLLEILLRSAGHAVPRESLVHSVLARQFSPFDRSLDMLVSRLRKKLDLAGIAHRIKTVRSIGYQFATSPLRQRMYSNERSAMASL